MGQDYGGTPRKNQVPETRGTPPPCLQTDVCKNITSRRTSYAGCKNYPAQRQLCTTLYVLLFHGIKVVGGNCKLSCVTKNVYMFYCLLFQGIEVVDGKCKLSCVTTNVYSDWSTQPWPTNRLAIRVYKLGNDFVVNDHLIKFQNLQQYPKIEGTLT